MLADAHFGVVGAGGWGTALAVVINRAGSRATLWTRNENVLRLVQEKRVNDAYLPDVFIDHDTPAKQYDLAGLNAPQIVQQALMALGQSAAAQLKA